MQVKKFEAKSMQEALQKIKLEMGPEAIILQAKKKKGSLGVGNTGVEVTAAIPQTAIIKKQYAESRMPKDLADKLKNSSAKIQKETYDKYGDVLQNKSFSNQQQNENTNQKSKRAIIKTRYIDIKEEDQILEDGTVANYTDSLIEATQRKDSVKIDLGINKSTIKTDRKNRLDLDDSKVSEKLHYKESDDRSKLDLKRYTTRMMIMERLIFEGVDKFYVDQIMNVLQELTKGNLDDIEGENIDRILIKIMSSQIKVDQNLLNIEGDGPKVFAFVGPTGSGKTSTLAKIAAKLTMEKGLKVGIICFDDVQVGGLEQLKVYAKLLNLPIRMVKNNAELLSTLRSFSYHDAVLIDTPGINHKDGEKLNWLSTMLSIDYPLTTNLVLSAATRDMDQKEIVEYYKNISYNSIIFTKLDEVSMYGNIFNACVRSKTPLCFTTMGQKVPEDITIPSAEEIAELIVSRP